MVTRVIARSKALRVFRVAHRLVEIYATIKDFRLTQPFIESLAHLVAHLVICAPTVNGQQCTAIHFKVIEFSVVAYIINVYLPRTLLQILKRRHVAPRAERIYVSAYGVYDVIDAMLNYHGRSPCHVYLYGETG